VVLMRIALPRFRIDQMLSFNWKVLTPLALVLLMVTAIVEKILFDAGITLATAPAGYVAAHLTANALIFAGYVWLSRSARKKREIPLVGKPRPTAVAPKASLTPLPAGEGDQQP
jgi:hypothetical protein